MASDTKAFLKVEHCSLSQVSHMGRSALWHSTADGRGAEAMHGEHLSGGGSVENRGGGGGGRGGGKGVNHHYSRLKMVTPERLTIPVRVIQEQEGNDTGYHSPEPTEKQYSYL